MLSLTEVNRQYPQLVDAARRRFGSWPKAVIAAGIGPRETEARTALGAGTEIIQAILARALHDERLGSHSVQPRSLAEAGARVFGSWRAAIAAAGLDPMRYAGGPESRFTDATTPIDRRPGHFALAEGTAAATGVATRWTSETVV